MAIRKKIGHRIRDLRRERNPELSVNKLAIMAEVDPGQLSRAERGLAGLSIDALVRIANALNTSLADLVDPIKARSKDRGHEGPNATFDEYSYLLGRLTDFVWREIEKSETSACSKSEKELILHHIRASIETGLKRGRIQAEEEIEMICSKQKAAQQTS